MIIFFLNKIKKKALQNRQDILLELANYIVENKIQLHRWILNSLLNSIYHTFRLMPSDIESFTFKSFYSLLQWSIENGYMNESKYVDFKDKKKFSSLILEAFAKNGNVNKFD